MQFTGVLAQAAVADLTVSEPWYAVLFGRAPDLRPMTGLLEWHLGDGTGAPYGVQVWTDADRAGHSCLVLAVADLDAARRTLVDAGLDAGEPSPGGGFRVVQLRDPDGNLVVLTGA